MSIADPIASYGAPSSRLSGYLDFAVDQEQEVLRRLQAAGINTLGELEALTPERAQSELGMGGPQIQMIRSLFADIGLKRTTLWD